LPAIFLGDLSFIVLLVGSEWVSGVVMVLFPYVETPYPVILQTIVWLVLVQLVIAHHIFSW